jgi:hypothetical protein
MQFGDAFGSDDGMAAPKKGNIQMCIPWSSYFPFSIRITVLYNVITYPIPELSARIIGQLPNMLMKQEKVTKKG